MEFVRRAFNNGSDAKGEREGSVPERLGTVLDRGVRYLPPAYFAMVMATGVIAIASSVHGLPWVAAFLGPLNVVVYVVLWALTIARVVRYPREVGRDMIDHVRGPGYFTVVAGTCVLGSQFVVLWNAQGIATALWVLGVLSWIGLTYVIFTGLTVKEDKPPLEVGLSGAWLIAVVATQAVAVLTATLAPEMRQPFRLEANFFALSMWLWGGMLYIWMISLIFYRYTFFRFLPQDLSPPYWINMGAMAISTLGGSILILNADASETPFLESILPFLKGFTVFYWATGTWWIPMLFILAVWRHVYKRFPLVYDPLYWGAVFPLGMYTLCTYWLIEAMELEFLRAIPSTFIYVSLAAWTLTFAGLLGSLWRNLRARSVRSSGG